jgi:hypothetical protein
MPAMILSTHLRAHHPCQQLLSLSTSTINVHQDHSCQCLSSIIIITPITIPQCPVTVVNTCPHQHLCPPSSKACPCQDQSSPVLVDACHCQCPSFSMPITVNTQPLSMPIIINAPCQTAQCFHQHVKCALDLLHQVSHAPPLLSFFWKYE